MTTRWHIMLMSLLLAAALVQGCATPPRHTVPEDHFTQLGSEPVDGPVRAEDIFIRDEAELTYAVIDDDDDQAKRVKVTRAPTSKHDATWSTREGEQRTEYWTYDEQGNVVLTAVYEAGDQAISLFDPPLTFPAVLEAGEVHEQQVSMRVIDADNAEIVKATGTGYRTIEYLDNQRIATPAGEMLAQRVAINFRAELGVATAKTKTMLFIVPGRGVVAEQTKETVAILGAFGRSSARTLVQIKP